MINISKSRFKSYLSSWFLGLYILVLAIVAIGTELFQLAPKGQKEISSYENPIKADYLTNLKTMIISNKLGSFTINENESNWMLKEPRQMPLKQKTKEKIFDSLKSITVKNIHQYEPINLSSFSLDKPILNILLFTKLDEKIEIKIGLINPINNTTYLTVSNQTMIYQTDILKNNLESLELSDFVDSKVFSMDISEVKSLEIFRSKSNSTLNKLIKENGVWKSKKYNVISSVNTQNSIQNIVNLKAQYIVDKDQKETITTINNYLENPLYTVVVKTKDAQHTYLISSLVKAIPGLKLEKRQFFIIKASNRKFPYIVAKDNLNLFQLRYQNLR